MFKCKREIQKFEEKFIKLVKKLFKKLTFKSYFKTFGEVQHISTIDKTGKMDLIVTSSYFFNISTRNSLVNLLRSIDYKRGSNKWVEQVAIAFMYEVIELYTKNGDEYIISELEEEIAERYNVSKNRLKTQVALFLNNLESGKDKFNILSYFSLYEIVMWKYRDIEKFQEDLELNKVSEAEIQIMKAAGRII